MEEKMYWAKKPANEIGKEIMTKVEAYSRYIDKYGFLTMWRRSYAAYYKPFRGAGKLLRGGDQGELTLDSVNTFRNLLLHIRNLSTQQKTAFDPISANTDIESEADCILARNYLDQELRTKGVDRKYKRALEYTLVLGDAHGTSEYDFNAGEDARPELDPSLTEGGVPKMLKKGESKFRVFAPTDVIRDTNLDSIDENPWHIFRIKRNKWELAAEFPDLEDQILEVSQDLNLESRYRISEVDEKDDDNIFVYELRHKKTMALPDGRLVQVLNDEVVLKDTPLPLGCDFVRRLTGGDLLGTPFGYTVAFDLLPIQESIDALNSTILSNQMAFGVQNILVPKGHSLNVVTLAGGLNLVEYDPKVGPPQALNLTSTPKEVFEYLNVKERQAENITGVNSVARGNPESSLKSGTALAMVQAQAIQFSQDLNQSYAEFRELTAMDNVELFKAFADEERQIEVAGTSKQAIVKNFSGKDLKNIKRVMVASANPLSQTVAGQVQLAENLIANKMVKNAQEYIQVLTTGRIDPLIEPEQMSDLLIKSENEVLVKGGSTPVMITDNHVQHILKHAPILSSPEARRNPTVVGATNAHLMEHIAMLANPGNSALLSILGQQPIGAPPALQPPPGGEEEANIKPSNPTELLNAEKQVMQEASAVPLPPMPEAPPA